MKYLIDSCIAALLSLPLAAQQSWDSTFRPDIYKARTAMFAAMPVGKKDIVFCGNSITFWGDWPELLGSSKYKNRGIPGDISFGLLELLNKGLLGKPRKIFILIGINDLAWEFLLRLFKIIIKKYWLLSDGCRPGQKSIFSPYYQSTKVLES